MSTKFTAAIMTFVACLSFVLAVPVLSIGASAAPVSVAEANTNCTGNHSAGCIFNWSSSRSLLVCEDWSGTSADPGCANWSRTKSVSPKTWSPFYDTDGYYVPSGYDVVQVNCYSEYGCRTTATGWHKVSNGTNYQLAVVPQ